MNPVKCYNESMEHIKELKKWNLAEFFAVVVLLLISGVGFFSYYSWQKTERELEEKVSIYDTNTQNLREEMKLLEARFHNVKNENDILIANLTDQERTNLELEREKRDKEEEVELLTKLTTIDPELLVKYSKVYFLSENYEPRKLKDVPREFLSYGDREIQVLSDMYPYLEDMLEDAKRDDIEILISSAYRSFESQQNLKSNYVVQYGSTTANRFSAEQGYSEHQLGTTVDLSTKSLGGALTGFDGTPAYKWMTENAYKHGFILSYPKTNAFYKYEPWHWRFVGEDLARDLHREGKYFYEWEQRDIDEYLVKIFD